MEQVNIEGKRSGEGFVAHKDTLVNALARVSAERVTVFDGDVTVGSKGFYNYLKALTGNVVKIVPVNGSASGVQATGKGLRIVCGSHQSNIPTDAWIREKSPLSFCQIRVSPCNAIMPNLGSAELAEAFARVLPFTTTDEQRPVLQCVKVVIKDSKLTLVSADGYRLAIANLNFGGSEGEALIHRDDVKGLIPALRKAKRARLAIEEKPDNEGNLLGKRLIVDTELISYKLNNQDGSFPNYANLIPAESNIKASFDTKEAIKASRNLLQLWSDDDTKPLYRALVLTVSNGKLTVKRQADTGRAEIEAETEGEGKIAVTGRYLIETLKACGGIVNFGMSSPTAPMVFSVDSYKVVVMPLLVEETKPTTKPEAEGVTEPSGAVTESKPQAKRKGKKAQKRAETEVVAQAEAIAEAEAIGEPTDDELTDIEAESNLVSVA